MEKFVLEVMLEFIGVRSRRMEYGGVFFGEFWNASVVMERFEG